MALIRCKNCGNFISDKAKACPKCGELNIHSQCDINEGTRSKMDEREKPGHTMDSDSNLMPEYGYNESEQDPKRSHKKLYILLALLLLVIVGGIGYYFYARHQVKLEEARLEAERIEQLRQDSIEAARIEAARLDSIRQDSIFRNFTSDDLRVFELHGKVKEVNYLSKKGMLGDMGVYISPVANIFKTDKFNFVENGDLVNKKESFISRNQNLQVSVRKYNENGYPMDGELFPDYGTYSYEERKWEWYPDGQLKETEYIGNMCGGKIEYEYNDRGDLIYAKYEDIAGSGCFYIIGIITVKNDETDKWGNWVKRTMTVKVEEGHKAYDASKPEPGYRLVVDVEGDYGVHKKNYTMIFTEQRTITYYDTNEK